MTRLAWLFILSLCAVPALSAENLIRNPDFASGLDQWEVIGRADGFRPEKGGIVVTIPPNGYGKDSGEAWTQKLQQVQRLKRGGQYKLFLTVDSEQAQTKFLVISYRMREKAKNLGTFLRVPLFKGAQRLHFDIIPNLESEDSENDPPVLSLLSRRIVRNDPDHRPDVGGFPAS